MTKVLRKYVVTLVLLCLAATGPQVSNGGAEEDHSSELFAFLVRSSQFGYTLWGDKPVSVAGYFVTPPLGNVIYRKVTPPIGVWWREFEAKYLPIESEAYLLLFLFN